MKSGQVESTLALEFSLAMQPLQEAAVEATRLRAVAADFLSPLRRRQTKRVSASAANEIGKRATLRLFLGSGLVHSGAAEHRLVMIVWHHHKAGGAGLGLLGIDAIHRPFKL